MYDVLVFDHRLAEHRPLDSKSELARLLFGYTTGNGQRFPAQPDLVRFVARPARTATSRRPDRARRDRPGRGRGHQLRLPGRGRRTEGTLARIGNGELRVR